MKTRLKWPKPQENHEAQFPKRSVCVGRKSILRHYYIQNVKDGIQIRVYKIKKECVTHFSQSSSSSLRLFINEGCWPLSGHERVTEARLLLRLLV